MKCSLCIEDVICLDKKKILDKNIKNEGKSTENHFKNGSFDNFSGLKNKYKVVITSLCVYNF